MADRRRPAALAAALLSAALLLTACGGGSSQPDGLGISRPDNGGYHGTYLGDQPFRVADQALTDTDGKPFSVATSDAPVKVVFFGYSHCPDICNIVLATIAQALTKVERDQVQVIFVTTDPSRDTRGVLRSYLDRFADGFVGLTGSLPDIVRLGDSFKVSIVDGKKLPSGGYEVDHSTYSYGVRGDGAEVIWNSTISSADMAADISKLLKS